MCCCRVRASTVCQRWRAVADGACAATVWKSLRIPPCSPLPSDAAFISMIIWLQAHRQHISNLCLEIARAENVVRALACAAGGLAP